MSDQTKNRTALNRNIMAVVAKRGLDKEELVSSASEGRTISLRALTDTEAGGLAMLLGVRGASTSTSLRLRSGGGSGGGSDTRQKQRRRVIALMASVGYTTPEGKPDMVAIESWVRKQKHKKEFNALNRQELSLLIVAAEAVVKHFFKENK